MALKEGVEVRSLDPDARLSFLKLPARPSADAENPILFLDIASDGRHILAASAHNYWVWALDGSATVHAGSCGDFPDIDAARFLGAGERVLVKCGNDLKVLAASDLHSVLALHDVSAFDVSRDGRLIATDKDVRAILDGKVVLALPPSDEAPALVAFSPDGRSLAVARYRTVAIWDVTAAAKSPRMTIEVQSSLGMSWITYAPDGKSLVTASSGEIRVWDAESGELTTVWSDNRTNLSSELPGPDRAHVSADGRWLLTASNWQDGMYTTRSTLWSLIHPDALPVRVTRGEAEIPAAAFTQGPAPIFATVDKLSARGGVFIWSADSSLTLHRWTNVVAGSFELLPAATGSNDIIVKNSGDGSLMRCGFDTFSCARAPPSALAALDTVIATPKGKAMLALQGPALVATSLQDGSIVWRRELPGAGSGGADFKVLAGGAYVLWTAGLETPHPTLVVLRAVDGMPARTFDDASAVGPLSGRLVVVATRPKGFTLVDLDTGKRTPLDLPGDSVSAAAASRDGARAAIVTLREDTSAASGTVQFLTAISMPDGHMQHSGRIEGTDGYSVSRADFSPDGRTLLVGDQIIDAKSGRRIAALAADTAVPVWSSQYSPDGRLIFAFYDAGLAHATTLRIFAAADGMLLQTFVTSPSLLLQFSQDGKAFVVQDYDGLGIHLVPTPDAIAARTRRLLESADLLAAH